ncbi:Bug family tripartite tricarboxylate transporter substrate binding protein [Rhodobaculum claviforme]|uniref:Bordetella uptake protein n=1 Tax=Rhodobaculum claviforme TaxID=1549854 RepID=A0A934TJ36_9RHOB|nr:tripartite tricarboxylate transporter substrate binding protein [Rhodobaculum claviforme]MBK5925953.1 Bordetella uptake protein [Rhodobaculum claviforme]
MTRSTTAILKAAAAAATVAVLAGPAAADSFPEREVQMIIPFGPGGATDIIFRLIAAEAEKHLGQAIVPVNMPGAGATRGSRHVLEAAPDGYTVLASHDTIALSNLAGMVDYSYDAFAPVALVTQTINIASTHADHPAQTAADIAEMVRENPGRVRFSMIPTSTDHFFWAQFFDAAGISMDDVRMVGYADTGEQVAALMAREIDFTVLNMPSGGAHYAAGTFRPLGVAHDARLGSLPDAPTMAEQGIALEHATSRGIFAPLGTPQDRVDTLAAAFGAALETPELVSRIETEFGSIVRFLQGAEYQAFLDANLEGLTRAAGNIDFEG